MELFYKNEVDSGYKINQKSDEVRSARLVLQNFLHDDNNDQEQILDALKTL